MFGETPAVFTTRLNWREDVDIQVFDNDLRVQLATAKTYSHETEAHADPGEEVRSAAK
jgi:hypothetical protein